MGGGLDSSVEMESLLMKRHAVVPGFLHFGVIGLVWCRFPIYSCAEYHAVYTVDSKNATKPSQVCAAGSIVYDIGRASYRYESTSSDCRLFSR